MSCSGAAVIAGELLDKHGYRYTFCIAAGLCAVALVVFSPLLLLKLRLPSEAVEVFEVSPNAPVNPDLERDSGAAGAAGAANPTANPTANHPGLPGAVEVVVVVDPFSTGGVLVAELLSQGYAVIALWTKESNIRYHDAWIARRFTEYILCISLCHNLLVDLQEW